MPDRLHINPVMNDPEKLRFALMAACLMIKPDIDSAMELYEELYDTGIDKIMQALS